MTLLQAINVQLDPRCHRHHCEDEDCCLELEGLVPSRYLLISMEGLGAPVSITVMRCDYLFFGYKAGSSDFWVVPIELTAGLRKSSTRIVAQLRAGADLADKLVPQAADIHFVPVAAGPFNRAKLFEMRRTRNRIAFRNQKFFLVAVSCGNKLADALG